MAETHLSYDQVQAGARALAEQRKAARLDYVNHAELAADAERDYRKGKAIAFARHRSSEKGVGESEILADGDSADDRHKRDLEHALAKAALLRVEEVERNQATMRTLSDWSRTMEAGQ